MEKKQINMTIGRFQPFTLGHLNMLKECSTKNNAPCIIYQIRTKDAPETLRGWKVGSKVVKRSEISNILKYIEEPDNVVLSEHEKDIMKRPFSNELINKELDIIKSNNKNLIYDVVYVSNMFEALIKFNDFIIEHSDEFEPGNLICGDDRYEAYNKVVNKYDELDSILYNKKVRNFLKNKLNVLYLERNLNGISATKVREAIIKSDKLTFSSLMPFGVGDKMWSDFKEAFDNFINKLKYLINESLNNRVNNNLVNYIMENLESQKGIWNNSVLGKDDWNKHEHLYPKKLISLLLNFDNSEDERVLYMGLPKKNNTLVLNLNSLNLKNEDLQLLTSIYNDIEKYSVQDLNNILIPYGIKWTKINKAQFTGVTYRGNKGNQFEYEFINDFFEKYDDLVKKVAKYDEVEDLIHYKGTVRRSLIINSDGSITAGNTFDIGDKIKDVTLNTTNNKQIFLSLKYSKTFSLSNIGINKFIPFSWFSDEINNDDKLTENGKKLFDVLCIKKDYFKECFKNYNPKNQGRGNKYIHHDVTEKILSNNNFYKLIKSCVGYGYIYIHKFTDGNLTILDLRKEEQLNNFIGKIQKVEVCYPTTAKRVKLVIETTTHTFEIVIREKNGKTVFPTHMMFEITK